MQKIREFICLMTDHNWEYYIGRVNWKNVYIRCCARCKLEQIKRKQTLTFDVWEVSNTMLQER